MGREIPPQTVGEALDFRWTALSFICDRPFCGHRGRIDLAPHAERDRSRPLASLFVHAVCGKCGARPSFAFLAAACTAPDGGGQWEEKKVEFYENRTLRPSRE
jgi:hypothetical protein